GRARSCGGLQRVCQSIRSGRGRGISARRRVMAGNPIAELQAMVGGGGGMPQGTPPAMGAAMGQRSGMGDPMGGGMPGGGGLLGMIGPYISQFLGKMMADPQAMATIGGVLSDIAGPQNAPPTNPQIASADPSAMMGYHATETGLPPGPEAAGMPMGEE